MDIDREKKLAIVAGIIFGAAQALFSYTLPLLDPILARVLVFIPIIITPFMYYLVWKKKWLKYLLIGLIFYSLTALALLNTHLAVSQFLYFALITVASTITLLASKNKPGVLEGTYKLPEGAPKPATLPEVLLALVISFPLSIFYLTFTYFFSGIFDLAKGNPTFSFLVVLSVFPSTLLLTYIIIATARKFGKILTLVMVVIFTSIFYFTVDIVAGTLGKYLVL